LVKRGRLGGISEIIRDTSATPSGIKREWYVCMYTENFGEKWAPGKNIQDASATPSGMEREWYVCIPKIIEESEAKHCS
jgi:hypothetical protein